MLIGDAGRVNAVRVTRYGTDNAVGCQYKRLPAQRTSGPCKTCDTLPDAFVEDSPSDMDRDGLDRFEIR